jgi:hypothetical protein
VLIALALASAAVVAFLRLMPKRTGSRAVVIAAAFVLAWNAYGEISFARASHRFVDTTLSTVPRPLDWVDRAVPSGAQVYYVGQSVDDAGDVLQLEFWNRRIQHVWSTDGTAPGPGPSVIPDLAAPDGRLEPAAGVQYVVADYGISPVGSVVTTKIHRGGRGARPWTLVRITPPLRVRQTLEGVYPDGWGKPVTALNQFSIPNGTASTVRVHVSRTQAARLYPATVNLTVGTLTVSGGRPAIGEVLFTRRLRVRSHLEHVFEFDAPPAPFRVETSVTPFPHERDPSIGDPRDLGATISYSVTPRTS